jgi:hypothetical protein
MSIDIGRELQRLKGRLDRVERSPRLAHASIDNTSVEIRDGAGGLKGLVGVQADGTAAVNIVNGAAPPQTSAPIVASVLGGVTVSWDGLFAGGAVIPLDWARVEVHASILAVFEPVPATLQGTIETAQGATVVIPCDTAVYVRLVARNTSGTASVASNTVGPFGPTPVVADDILDGIVTTVKLAANAVTAAKVATGAISSTALQDGAVLEAKLAANAVTTGKLADLVVTDTKLAAQAVTAAKVAVGAIGSDQLALGIGNLAPDPSFEGAYTTAVITGHADWTVVTPGNNSAKALHVDCTAGGVTWKNLELARYPVLPGERHYLAVDYKTSVTFNGSGVKLMFRYEDASATVLGYGVADHTFTPGDPWARATAQVQAPTNTRTAVLLLEASQVTAGEAWFDNIEVRTLIAGGMVAAGTITATEIAALTILAGNLAADSVAAGKVAADAITAREIAASAVTASEIAANAVTAAKVAAGAITTDKLTVTGGANILTDPSFEGAYTASLVAGSTYASQDLTKGNGTPASLKIDATSATAIFRSVALTAMPILPGEQLNLAADYWVSADWVGTEISIHARWEDATGAVLSYGKAVTTTPVRAAWTRLSGTVTAPANAVTARIRVESGSATAGTVWWDNAAVRPVLGGTQIQDGVITTQKIAALTILAGNIAADAISAGKIATDAVTAREIAALAVTASELAANAVTAGKILAGSVDATALAADAITGKTITGGTITGALIQTAASGQRITLNEASANKVLVYNSSGTAIGELSASGLLVKGTNGALLWLDPNNTFPNLRLTTADGTNSAVINVSGASAVLGMNSGLFTGSSFSDMKWRTIFGMSGGSDFWAAERVRDSDTNTIIGGRFYLDNDQATVSYKDTTGATTETLFHVVSQLAQLNGGRLEVLPPASANVALYVNAATGHTGNLLRAQLNAVDKFTVDKDGNVTAAGNLTVSGVGNTVTKRRTSNATKTSTVTLATDTQITFTVDANAVYTLDGLLLYSGPGDFQMGWTYPSGTAGTWQGLGNGTTVVSGTGGGGTQQDISSSWGYGTRTETTDLADPRTYGGISTNGYGVHVRATIRVGGTGGTFALQWAQGASNATATTLYTDSHLRLEKVA